MFNWFKKCSSKTKQLVAASGNLVESHKQNTVRKTTQWNDLQNKKETVYYYPTVNIYDDSTVKVIIEVDVPRNTFVELYGTYKQYYNEIRSNYRSKGSEFDKWLEKNNLTLVDVTFKVIK